MRRLCQKKQFMRFATDCSKSFNLMQKRHSNISIQLFDFTFQVGRFF